MTTIYTDEYGNTTDEHGNPVDAYGNPLSSPAPVGWSPDPAPEAAPAPEGDWKDQLWAQAEARQAERDAEYDEYGLKKPHTPKTVAWTDEVAPPEIMNDPRVSDAEKIARGFAAAGAGLYGHFADQLPVPILGELAHAEEERRYAEARAAAEQAEYDRQMAEAQAWMADEATQAEATSYDQTSYDQTSYDQTSYDQTSSEATTSY